MAASEFPNVYSTTFLLNVGSTAPTIASFGFLSKYVRITNLGAVDIIMNPQNAAATTAGFVISSCQASFTVMEVFAPVTLAGVGLQTTSTGAGGQRVSILALG